MDLKPIHKLIVIIFLMLLIAVLGYLKLIDKVIIASTLSTILGYIVANRRNLPP